MLNFRRKKGLEKLWSCRNWIKKKQKMEQLYFYNSGSQSVVLGQAILVLPRKL